jgi:hypothetical protein
MRALWLSLALFLPLSSLANIGKISEVQGSAIEIRRGKEVIKASNGTVVESNDTVSVGSNTKLTITFVDNSTAKITENSKLVIDDFVYDPKGASKSAMRVTLGTVRMASGGIAKQNSQNVNIKTPTASIAVRGTDFAMTVSELGESTVVLLPTCKDDRDATRVELPGNCVCGAIDVVTSAGRVSMDSPFYATHVANAQDVPLPPVRVDPQVINASGEGNLNRPQAVALAVAEKQERKESAKDNSKASSDEQRSARTPGGESTAKKNSEDQLLTKKDATIESVSKTVTVETTSVNPCAPFSSCGNEKGVNWYQYDDPLRGNVIHIRSLEIADNTTYNISVNSTEILQRVVGNGSNIVTVRQWNQ